MGELLRFRFKGSRNYVQGGDIFDAAEALFAGEGRHVIGLVFRRFSRQQLRCVFKNPGETAMTEGVSLNADGARQPFWLVETGEPVTERYVFNEEAITNGAKVENDTISAVGADSYSVIEQIIALTKALNYARKPEIDGKWVFGQLRLKQPLPNVAQRYRIRQKALLANRFSTQEIELDGVTVGEIRFITGQP